jgi:anthranilate phosphoribosyltransferase
VLEALGVVIDLGPEGVERCVREASIGFCFAPRFHPAMRFAGPPRREMGVATTFNFLGPLANPAGVRRQAVGVSDPAMAERMIGTLEELGAQRALVFFGHDGLDELTTTTTSTVYELRDGSVRRYDLDPATLGIPVATSGALGGGDAAGNAAAVHHVLSGQAGPVRDIAVLNASAALVAAGIADDIAGGIDAATASIDEGRAAAVLEGFVRTSVAAREEGA